MYIFSTNLLESNISTNKLNELTFEMFYYDLAISIIQASKNNKTTIIITKISIITTVARFYGYELYKIFATRIDRYFYNCNLINGLTDIYGMLDEMASLMNILIAISVSVSFLDASITILGVILSNSDKLTVELKCHYVNSGNISNYSLYKINGTAIVVAFFLGGNGCSMQITDGSSLFVTISIELDTITVAIGLLILYVAVQLSTIADYCDTQVICKVRCILFLFFFVFFVFCICSIIDKIRENEQHTGKQTA